MALLDLTAKRFGRLRVISRSANRIYGAQQQAAWMCECDCGQSVVVAGVSLRSGATRSCGCLKREVTKQRSLTHGMSYTPTFVSWAGMLDRCYRPAAKHYHRYGGRGITVCAEWRESFEAFLRDMGPCPKGHSIDRINNNGNYERANCRWATKREQANNTSTNRYVEFEGATHTVTEWERELRVIPGTLKRRLLRGWTVERAFQQPVRHW